MFILKLSGRGGGARFNPTTDIDPAIRRLFQTNVPRVDKGRFYTFNVTTDIDTTSRDLQGTLIRPAGSPSSGGRLVPGWSPAPIRSHFYSL